MTSAIHTLMKLPCTLTLDLVVELSLANGVLASVKQGKI